MTNRKLIVTNPSIQLATDLMTMTEEELDAADMAHYKADLAAGRTGARYDTYEGGVRLDFDDEKDGELVPRSLRST